jgi:LacI family transcriptional regulator
MRLHLKRVSITDVAKKANVSIATVSRIVNKTPYPISDDIRKKVEKVIHELNYVPNISAQRLRIKTAQVIGLVVRDISDPYYSIIAKGVTETALEMGHMAIICNSERNIKYEYEYLDLLIHQGVEAIILAGGGYADKTSIKTLKDKVGRLQSQGIKITALAPNGIDIPHFMVDNSKVMEYACEYLVKNNHRNIAYIGGDIRIITELERFGGYMKCLDKNMIKIPKESTFHGSYTSDSGFDMCLKLLASKQSVSAICCTNDNIAIGVIKCLRENGLDVPNDISIISIGDLPISNYTDPSLTTVHLPLYELGSECVRHIFDKPTNINKIKYLQFDIIARESVKMIDFAEI